MSIEYFSSWGWVQTSLISADSGEKQVLWLKHNEGRSEETADTIFFFFFCKYLTWIIQIWTCWSMAGCPFYSHSFRESTENTLQHSRSGSKRRKKKWELFRRMRTHLEPVAWRTLDGWLAGWPASRHHTCTYLSAAGSLVNNAQKKVLPSSCMMEQEASWVPRSPDPSACSWVPCLTLNKMPETPQSVLVCCGLLVWWWKKGQEASFCRKTVPLRVWCCCFGQMERNMEELGLLGKSLPRGE